MVEEEEGNGSIPCFISSALSDMFILRSEVSSREKRKKKAQPESHWPARNFRVWLPNLKLSFLLHSATHVKEIAQHGLIDADGNDITNFLSLGILALFTSVCKAFGLTVNLGFIRTWGVLVYATYLWERKWHPFDSLFFDFVIDAVIGDLIIVHKFINVFKSTYFTFI